MSCKLSGNLQHLNRVNRYKTAYMFRNCLLCFLVIILFHPIGYTQPVWTRLKAFAPAERDFNSVKFVNIHRGWAIGINDLMQTSDGGQTWKLHYSFSYPNVFPDFHLQVRAMDFTDSLHGMLGRSNGDVHITEDGGKTFKTVHIPDFSIRGMDMVTPDIAWVCGSSNIDSQATTLIYKTVDGGDTWTSQLIPTTYGLIDIRFINTLTGWVCGVGGIFKTTDGGATWLQLGGGPNYGILQVQFLDSNTGYALSGAGILFKSNNGGNAWLPVAQLDSNGQTSGYQSMEFITVTNGMIGNISTGSMFHTLDGGQTWDHTKLRIVQDISFIDSTHAWAVGCFDTVFVFAEPSVSVNQPPVIKNANGDPSEWITAETEAETPLVVCLFVSDPDGNQVDISAGSSLTGNGTVTLAPAGDTCFVYTPAAGFKGTDTLLIYVCDDGSPSRCDSVRVSVLVDTSETGIQDLTASVKLFPNPAGNHMTIMIPETFLTGSVLEVYDRQGNAVIWQTLNEAQTNIDLSRQAPGLYFLRISHTAFSRTAKIVKY